MVKVIKYKVLMFAAGLLFFASCNNVIVIVDSIPSNTPADQPLYITGNFNNWDPGDERYQLQLNNDSNYILSIIPRRHASALSQGNWCFFSNISSGFSFIYVFSP